MPNHNLGFLHQHLRKRIHQKKEKFPHPDKFKRFYDKFIFIIAIATPFVNLPQLLQIWISRDAAGVSAISWFGFSITSFFWCVYGILHKEKPIWMMNIFLIIMHVLIAIGALIY